MQTILLILILLLTLIDIKEGIRIRQLEKKTLSAFRVICEKVIANERKLKNLGKEGSIRVPRVRVQTEYLNMNKLMLK